MFICEACASNVRVYQMIVVLIASRDRRAEGKFDVRLARLSFMSTVVLCVACQVYRK